MWQCDLLSDKKNDRFRVTENDREYVPTRIDRRVTVKGILGYVCALTAHQLRESDIFQLKYLTKLDLHQADLSPPKGTSTS
jgi:hypothetical protein